MLIEFKVANYRSIKDEITLSFVAERAPRHAENLIDCDGYKLLKAMAMFGANASGKSNIIKALWAMRDFVTQSATQYSSGDTIPCAEPYLLDTIAAEQPSRFEVMIKLSEGVYRYGFAATPFEVEAEWLYHKSRSNAKETTLFHHSQRTSETAEIWTSDILMEDEMNFLALRARSNALRFSVGVQFNVQAFLPLHQFFQKFLFVHDMSEPHSVLFDQTAEACLSDEEFLRTVSDVVRDADTSIESLYVRYQQIPYEYDIKTQKYSRLLPGELSGDPNKSVRFRQRVVTQHRSNDGNLKEFDMMQQESHGTQRLFGLAGSFVFALKKGHVVVLDEFDASLHPRLTRALVQLFQSATANKNGAQLLFTTHDIALFSSDLFRRDQLILVEKYSTGTEIYSLADLEKPPRNDSAFMPHYLAGQFGGTAHLGRTFEENTIIGLGE